MADAAFVFSRKKYNEKWNTLNISSASSAENVWPKRRMASLISAFDMYPSPLLSNALKKMKNKNKNSNYNYNYNF